MWREDVYNRRRQSSLGGESPIEARQTGIDEAHLLTDQIPEEIRLLTNFRRISNDRIGALRCGLTVEDEVVLASHVVISMLQNVSGTARFALTAVSLLL